MGKKLYITREQLNLLTNARNSVRGTSDYLKYNMAMEYKYTKMNTNWYFIGYSIPSRIEKPDFYYTKRVKDNLYIISEPYYDELGHLNVERFTVSEAVQELLHI